MQRASSPSTIVSLSALQTDARQPGSRQEPHRSMYACCPSLENWVIGVARYVENIWSADFEVPSSQY
jgi:hypothetical protein